MEPQFWVFASVFLVFLSFQLWLLPVLTHWISSAVDEGYTSYAAERIRLGQWPHRDFFFLWTPGTAYLHALLQGAGLDWLGERCAALFAFLGSLLLMDRFARERLSRGDHWLLRLLLCAFSFSLWNIPYSSWYAVLAALLAIRLLPRSQVGAALLFALAFWFKQNVGILACLGAGLSMILSGERRNAFRFGGCFLASLAFPFFLIGILGGRLAFTQAFSQIFLFPLRYPQLMGTAPPAASFAAPLTAFGLWTLSLFFLRADANSRSARFLQLGVLAYVGVYASRAPWEFILASFVLLSVLGWPLALALEWARDKKRIPSFLALWLPGLGVFAQVVPRLDFQHLLFVFPLSGFFLVQAVALLAERYPALPKFWLRMPLWLLLLGGITLQVWVVQLRLDGSVDSLGRISSGEARRLNEEVIAVWRYLKSEGLKEGDPVLVLPNATSFYRWTGFRNITPHQQFFPGYVEAFGASQKEVLAEYRRGGGRFLVVQERSDLDRNTPEIFRQIQTDYEVARSFPENFTVYIPRSGL